MEHAHQRSKEGNSPDSEGSGGAAGIGDALNARTAFSLLFCEPHSPRRGAMWPILSRQADGHPVGLARSFHGSFVQPPSVSAQGTEVNEESRVRQSPYNSRVLVHRQRRDTTLGKSQEKSSPAFCILFESQFGELTEKRHLGRTQLCLVTNQSGLRRAEGPIVVLPCYFTFSLARGYVDQVTHVLDRCASIFYQIALRFDLSFACHRDGV